MVLPDSIPARQPSTVHFWNLRVAGLTIRIQSPLEMFAAATPPHYREFVFPDGGAGGGDLECELLLEPPLPLKPERKLFGVDGSWSIFTGDGGERILELPDALNPAQLMWQVHFTTEARRARIYCGPRLTQTNGDGASSVVNPIQYPLDQLLLMYHLAGREGVLLHAAGVKIEGRSYVFLGKSGAGKSTLSRQLRPRSDWELMSDDRIIIRRVDGVEHGNGTPWPGEALIAHNESAPLGGLFFLEKSPQDRITRIEPREALRRMMPVASIPWYDAEVMGDLLTYCRGLVDRAPAYVLDFRPTVEIADVIERHLRA